MRIFSIHKSKSKKQVSEKSPKLAAQKFLEKRKVGTVIYLHEHPSGKIHGPYRKDYDKKIMKGGFIFGSVSVSDFKIPRSKNNSIIYPPLLEGTDQLIIKIDVDFLREPHIFFGNSNFKHPRGSRYYYKYLVLNKRVQPLSNKKNITTQVTIYKVDDKFINVVSEEINKIDPKVLLGLYYQYIIRCKQDYPSSNNINYEKLYMRRLFLYLLIHVLPIINNFINIDNNIIKNLNQKEQEYYCEILEYILHINIDNLIREIAKKYYISNSINIEEVISEINNGYEKFKNKIKQNKQEQTNNKLVENATEKISITIQEGYYNSPPERTVQKSSSLGNIPLTGTPIDMITVPCVAIGMTIYGVFWCSKKIYDIIEKKRNTYGEGDLPL